MKPERVRELLAPLPFPYMNMDQGDVIYELIVKHKLADCLQLGFHHGLATGYIAGALDEVGRGSLIAIDMLAAKLRTPNIREVVDLLGVTGLVSIYFEDTSYSWRLMRLLEEDRFESFDFCHIDAGRTWTSAGFSYCLASRLIREGGWLLFEDLHFSYSESSLASKDWVLAMPREEQVAPQMLKVFELLVENDPFMGNFRRMGRFGLAQKVTRVWLTDEAAEASRQAITERARLRARVDPDFRAWLLADPESALSSISSRKWNRKWNVVFREKGTAHDVSDRNVRLYFLDEPSWNSTFNEAELKKLLQQNK